MASVAEIDALLPQTQCTRCGFSGCRPYAQAVADGVAPINQCPPGGTPTILALSTLLKREPLPLNPANGVEAPALIAVIDEERCIGCAKCLPPCPVDAIVGARKQMHTVLAALCTGCELCVAPCPVDCIAMIARGAEAPPSPDPGENRTRYSAHERRLADREERHATLLAARKQMAHRTSR
jgi:Na+-translocating ferredoxin:NAD+ oxidoreductase subunit B